MRHKIRAILCAALVVFSAQTLNAQTIQQLQQQQQGNVFPFNLELGLSHYLGQGSFISGYANNSYFASNLRIRPSLNFGNWGITAHQSADLEWTLSDVTSYARQPVITDTRIGAYYSGVQVEGANLGFIFSGGVSLPTSMVSRHAGKVLGVNGRISLNHTFGPGFMLSAGVGASYNGFVPELAGRGADNPVRPLDSSGQTIPPASCIRRVATELADYGCGVIPRIGSASGNLGLTWIGADNQLFITIAVAASQRFSAFPGPNDEFTSENAVVGIAPEVWTDGTIDITYQPLQNFSLSFGTNSFQPVYQGYLPTTRWFPFWDTVAPTNYSTLYFDTTFWY